MAFWTAICVAVFKSLSIPIAMKCVGVSARGQARCMSLRTTSWRPADERGLDGGLIHFPVSLRRVTITDLEQGTRGMDRNEQCRPGDQLLVVNIPGVDAGRV